MTAQKSIRPDRTPEQKQVEYGDYIQWLIITYDAGTPVLRWQHLATITSGSGLMEDGIRSVEEDPSRYRIVRESTVIDGESEIIR